MTHHITSKTLLDKVRSSRRSFENTRCSWCQTEANYWTSIGEENFVQIQGKTLSGEQAFAVFCPDCLKDENRKNEVKYAMTIGDAEDAVPAQVQFRDLQSADIEEGQKWPGNNPVEPPQPSEPTPGPEQTGVPAEEATGSGVVQTRATENVADASTGTRVATQEDTKKKKGLFG